MSESKYIEFAVTSMVITPKVVVTDSPATVKADIRNLNDGAGICKVILKVNGIEGETKEVTLEGSETKLVSFDVTKSTGGKYDIEINGVSEPLIVAKLKKYTSPLYKYSVSFPGGWAINDKNPALVKMESKSGLPGLVITAKGLKSPAVVDAEKLEEAIKPGIINNSTQVFISDEKVRLDKEIQGYVISYTGKVNAQEIMFKQLNLVSGQALFGIAIATYPGNQWDAWHVVADAILESFVPPTPGSFPLPPPPAPKPAPPPPPKPTP
ncbi:hypothetical protein ACFLRP_05075 [Bacteroidota bacterium]